MTSTALTSTALTSTALTSTALTSTALTSTALTSTALTSKAQKQNSDHERSRASPSRPIAPSTSPPPLFTYFDVRAALINYWVYIPALFAGKYTQSWIASPARARMAAMGGEGAAGGAAHRYPDAGGTAVGGDV